VVYGLGIWINALRDLSGRLGNKQMGMPIQIIKIVGKGMIGSERGGDRVIGNYGMRRESSFLHFTSAL
jgi:hypothetical protein